MTGAANSSLIDLLGRTFDDVIVPLARSGGEDRLDFAPQPKDSSYFKTPTRHKLSRADMEAIGRSGELAALAALWRSQQREGLLALIPHLEAVAAQLAETAAEASVDGAPSTLIYQMY